MRVLWATLKLSVVCALFVAAAVWLTRQPGDLHLTFRGAEVETSAGFALLLLLLLCMILWKVGKLFFWAKYGWARRRERRLRLKHEHGLQLLTASFNAMAAQDLRIARRAQIGARKHLGDVPLVTWIGAQIAERQHDTVAAQKSFMSLTADPAAANLGWRGMMSAHATHGQMQQVMQAALADKRIARQSYVHEARISDAARRGDWLDARAAIDEARKRKALTRERLNRLEQVQLLERGLSLRTSEPSQALLLIERAYKMSPDFLPAALAYIDLLIDTDRKLAGKVIATAWLIAPDEALFDRFQSLYAAEPALARLQRFERFAQKKKNNVETQLALGQLSLEAELYGKAQGHIEQAQKIGESVRGFDLLADLAIASKDDAHRAHSLARAGQGIASTPRYKCTVCETPYQHWQMLCERCGAFAAIDKI